MGAVVEESQCAASAGGVVDDLCHHVSAFVEKQFVAYPYLSGRLHKHIPQAHLFVEFTKQEHLNLGVGLLLGAVETGGKHFGIVEYECIAFIKVVEDVPEIEIYGVALFVFQGFSILVFLVHLDFL